VKLSIRSRTLLPPKSAFAGFRFPAEVIVVAVRWYLRYNLSYRDVEELLVERGIEVDHVTVYRWVQRFTPLLADAARFARHSPGDRWHVDETYIKVNGVWRYVYRAIDQYGQVIDVLVSARRGADAARRLFEADHSHLKHRLKPMRGLRTDRTAQVVIAGHAVVQNLRRGHYELGLDVPSGSRVAAAFTELARTIRLVRRTVTEQAAFSP
jgi:transposase-like protein